MPRKNHRFRSWSAQCHPLRQLFPLWLGAMSAVLTGCQIHDTDGQKQQAGRLLNSRRQESLRSWGERRIQGSEPANYAAARTAYVFPTSAIVPSPLHRKKPQKGRAGFHFRTRGDFSFGCAVPVSDDGYFLTAAHCVEDAPEFTVFVLGRHKTVEHAPVRVIWKTDRQRKGSDLALIHAPVKPWRFFPLREAPADRHTAVLTCGAGSAPPPNLTLAPSGGQIQGVMFFEPESGQPRSWSFNHNAPLAPGDSGGPVLDAEGRLLGINTGMTGRWGLGKSVPSLLFYRGCAEMLDPAWLAEIMERDRETSRPGLQKSK